MIQIDRKKVEKPKFFYSKEYERLQQEIRDFYGMHKNSRAQRTYSIEYVPNEVIAKLTKLFEQKCAFCESTLHQGKSGFENYLHRFRPDSYAQGFDPKDVSKDHYWWLTYEWENLYLCCHSCNRYKSNKFPVDGKRAAIETTHAQFFKKEKAFLIDPCTEDPSDFFEFRMDGLEIYPKTTNYHDFLKQIPEINTNKERAEATIQTFGLNREDLIYERKLVQEELARQLQLIAENPKEFYHIITEWRDILEKKSAKNHVLFRRTIINHYIHDKEAQHLLGAIMSEFESYITSNYDNNIENESYIDVKQQAPNAQIKGLNFEKLSSAKRSPKPRRIKKIEEVPFDGILKNVYLDRIVLRNFKCFSKLTLKLPDYSGDVSSEPWLVFLGENGVGKSSVLKAIALALMGQKYLDKLNLEVNDLLKYGTQKGFIRVYGKGKDEFYEIAFSKKEGKIVSNIHHPCAFLIGYGSTRLLPIGNLQPEEDHPNYIKVKNLFDASISLSDAKKWFLNTNIKTFNEVSRSLKSLLLLDDKDAIKRSIVNKQIFIKYHQTGDTINIDHLSDGYKSVFAIAIDMIHTLSKENMVYSLAEGIVLVDEVGTHLHPRWKMEVIERLRRTFPKIQFIITTHEPLCLRGIKANEVVVLKRNEENTIDAISDLPDPSSLRVDQLLTSEYFGLNSTIDIHTELLFKEYYELLAINESERTKDQKSRLAVLEKDVKELKYMRFGNDQREELVYQVVDELMAKEMRKKQLKIETTDIKQEAIDTVKNLWESL